MNWFTSILHRVPLRLTALVIGAIILVPTVLFASRFFPSMDRETIAVIFAFCVAAYLSFHVFGRRH